MDVVEAEEGLMKGWKGRESSPQTHSKCWTQWTSHYGLEMGGVCLLNTVPVDLSDGVGDVQHSNVFICVRKSELYIHTRLCLHKRTGLWPSTHTHTHTHWPVCGRIRPSARAVWGLHTVCWTCFSRAPLQECNRLTEFPKAYRIETWDAKLTVNSWQFLIDCYNMQN